MTQDLHWLTTRVRLGLLLLAGGALTTVVATLVSLADPSVAAQARIVGGAGILAVGIGTAAVIRYGSALRDDAAALRVLIEERDERAESIRQRAGHRAYLVSAAVTFVLLMWVSFAANGALPTLSGDALWFVLAAAFVVPGIVYVGSTLLDEHNR